MCFFCLEIEMDRASGRDHVDAAGGLRPSNRMICATGTPIAQTPSDGLPQG
jgi:hypothetical protein